MLIVVHKILWLIPKTCLFRYDFMSLTTSFLTSQSKSFRVRKHRLRDRIILRLPIHLKPIIKSSIGVWCSKNNDRRSIKEEKTNLVHYIQTHFTPPQVATTNRPFALQSLWASWNSLHIEDARTWRTLTCFTLGRTSKHHRHRHIPT